MPQSDLEILMREIQKKLERLKKVKSALKKVKGAGKDVWGMDAQSFVNQAREDDATFFLRMITNSNKYKKLTLYSWTKLDFFI